MMESDPFRTQRDVGAAVAAELSAAGFADADEIGRGGFGIVYRCTQVALDRIVAVKVLTAKLDEDRERFLREQRAMGRLTGYPNIVGVLQVGETESGYPYLVMPHHRQGSLEARIRRLGTLPLDEVLRVGVKMAGALESAHRKEILHRDVKPSNILLTDYGEPALSDFGIAHIPDGFKTATGTFTGSPAFTAPEILSGDPPSKASDVYGLGATLFAALTGHAAYERRSGEQVVAQFLRIATEPVPDLRERGIPDDIAAVVDMAMACDPDDRPSVLALGQELQRVQAGHGFAVDEMALWAADQPTRPARRTAEPALVRRTRGNVPLELTSFVGRRSELTEVKKLLTASRLVTLTGIGGVGKTRLALRAAAQSLPDYPDGGWLVELGELRDGSLLVDAVAAALAVRDRPGKPLRDVLVEYLSSRDMLIVLDNCEHVVEAAAQLTQTLLRACPQLRILATSREQLGIGGEAVLRLSPLDCPDEESQPSLHGLPAYDAVALFTERARAAVPGFTLTEANQATVARICSRLDGLPLAIELAAARLRALSPEQILERLADGYALLTRGSRGAPTRQQTLAWSIGWSYDLCAEVEQQLWSRLSVFAGSFELQAAQDICGENTTDDDFLDALSALVDKSILIRLQADGGVRFRLLNTLRDYGKERIATEQYRQLRRRHRDWYRRLLARAKSEWFGPRQLRWLDRIVGDMPNLREALEFSLSEPGQTAMEMAFNMHPVWTTRGMLSEGRRWLDRALAATPSEPAVDRIRAGYAAAIIADLQDDLAAAKTRVAEARALVEQMADPLVRGLIEVADGYTALASGEAKRACDCFERALRTTDDPMDCATSMVMMGWALEFMGDLDRALTWHEKALAFAESRGESVYRSYALWSVGVGWWRKGQSHDAEQLIRQCLQLTKAFNDPFHSANCLEVLAWIAQSNDDPRHAVVLMGAADALARAVGAPPIALPNLAVFHDECVHGVRESLGEQEFEAAWGEGNSLSFNEAIAVGIGENT